MRIRYMHQTSHSKSREVSRGASPRWWRGPLLRSSASRSSSTQVLCRRCAGADGPEARTLVHCATKWWAGGPHSCPLCHWVMGRRPTLLSTVHWAMSQRPTSSLLGITGWWARSPHSCPLTTGWWARGPHPHSVECQIPRPGWRWILCVKRG